MRTRHATDPPAVPMVERDAEGGGGGDLTDGPLDGQRGGGGVEGSKSKNSVGDHFVSQNNDFTRG